MNEIKNSTEEKWVLCHNNNDIFHASLIKVGGNLSSGQPNLEKFDTKDELIARIKAINPDYVIPKRLLD
jgi:hypothetical protein